MGRPLSVLKANPAPPDTATDALRADGDSAPIGIVINSMRGGGAERVALVVAEGLAAAGWRADLLLCTTRGHYLPSIRNPVRVCTLHTRWWSNRRRELRRNLHASVALAHFGPRWSPIWFSRLRVALRLFNFIPAKFINKRLAHIALAVADYIERERPQLLFAFLEGGEHAALLGNKLARQKTRVVVSIRCAMAHRKPDALRLAKIIFPLADGFTAVSDGLAEEVMREFSITRKKIKTIYNPTPPGLATLAAQEPSHAWFKDSSLDVILAVGRLEEQKDFQTLLRAFAHLERHPDLRLVVVGDGERNVLINLAAELGIDKRVDFPGWKANPYALMARARLFVLSSRYEGLPNVIIQSLACGCPVVSTDCPHGPREILGDGKWGRLVAVGDEFALGDAMESALREKPDRNALRERAKFFSVERAVRGYEEILCNRQR